MKKIILAAFIFAGILTFSQNVYGSKSINDLKIEQEKLKNETGQIKNSLTDVQGQKSAAQKELDILDEELMRVTEELERIGQQLEETNANLNLTQDQLNRAERSRDNQYETFKKRARYIYTSGKSSYIDVILQAKSFNDLIKRIDYVNRIVENDLTLIDKLKASEELITLKLTEIQKQKDDLDALEWFQNSQKNKYEAAVLEKEVIIVALEADEEKYQKRLDEAEAESKQVEQLIAKYQEEQRRLAAATNQPTYTYNGKKLQWPVPGRSTVSSGYINRVSPISGRREFHTGIDIPAPYGYNIIAAEAGTVISAGWYGGYGNCVIIDHGGGLSTLYGHNSSLVVKKGDVVARGQVIAKCGSTGYSTGNHCHFEVRINSKHVDPNPYVR